MIRNLFFSIISLMAVLVLGNCQGFGVEEVEKPVYTWEGRLFLRPGDQAWANKEVYLVVF